MSNEEKWLEFYRKTQREKGVYVERAWDTIKFHILLSTSIISVVVSALVALHTSLTFLSLDNIERAVTILLLLFLPSTMLYVLRVGKKNFKRECSRMYEFSAILIKLEEYFSLRGKRNDKNYETFSDEDTFNPPRFYEKRWNTTKSFIDDMLSCCHYNLYCCMNKLFNIFIVLSIILLILIIIIALFHGLGFFVLS